MQDARNHTQPHVHSQTTQRTHPPSTTESGRAGRPHWPLPRACLILRAPKSSTVQGQARPRAVVGVVAAPSPPPPAPATQSRLGLTRPAAAWMHLACTCLQPCPAETLQVRVFLASKDPEAAARARARDSPTRSPSSRCPQLSTPQPPTSPIRPRSAARHLCRSLESLSGSLPEARQLPAAPQATQATQAIQTTQATTSDPPSDATQTTTTPTTPPPPPRVICPWIPGASVCGRRPSRPLALGPDPTRPAVSARRTATA